MTDRPILFSGPMVRALIAGQKTQTRRAPPRLVAKGDRLWVRESWAIGPDGGFPYYYRATDHLDGIDDGDGFAALTARGRLRSPWRPSMYMPRMASRLTLQVTAVWIERLRDISDTDVTAEGINFHADDPFKVAANARDAYRLLWDGINGAGAWAKNPLVSAISFRVCHRNIDAEPSP